MNDLWVLANAQAISKNIYPKDLSMEMPIDQIGGWRSVATIGVGYGKGYSMEAMQKVMIKIQI